MNVNREPAQIYQFPAGGRASLGGPRHSETKPIEPNTPRNDALCSGSWYHEEAICESQPDFKSFWKR